MQTSRYKPIMITGDYKDTAIAIAKELNIADMISLLLQVKSWKK